MGNCICFPSHSAPAQERFIKPTTPFTVSTPTSNQSPKSEKPNYMVENTIQNHTQNKSPKLPNENKLDDEDEDIRDVSQIFIKEENVNLDNEDIKNQSKIKLEDFKLLKVFSF